MRLAQEIIHGIANREEAQAEVNAYTQSINIVQGYKTASKVGLFVTATIATGGGSLSTLGASSMTLGQAGSVVVGGVDCIVDVGSTASTIVLGENHQVTTSIENVKNKLAPISSVVGLASFSGGESGEQLAYIGDTLAEWYYSGTVFGVKVTETNEGGTKVTAESIDVSGLDESGVKSELKKAGFSTPEEEDTALSSILEEYRIILEAATSKLETIKAEMASILEEYSIVTQEKEETRPVEKYIMYKIRNNSGEACYLDSSLGNFFDDLDMVYVVGLVVESGGVTKKKGVSVESGIQDGFLVETSPNTYEFMCTLIYGGLPLKYPEDTLIDKEDLYVYNLKVSGTPTTDFNNDDLDIIIEWDGSSFKQVN